MAIAFDAVTSDTGGGGWATSPKTINHTPVGTPKGVLCGIVAGDASDVVSGVTYGGVALTRSAAASKISSTSTEGGSVYWYFLGASVPTGAQDCVITNTASGAGAVVITLTAAADTEVDAGATLDQSSGANPSATLATTASTTTFDAGILWSGQNAVTGITPGADYTQITEDDFGSQTVSFVRRTTNGSGGNITVDWTATSEDAVIGAIAIREAVAADPSMQICQRRLSAGWKQQPPGKVLEW